MSLNCSFDTSIAFLYYRRLHSNLSIYILWYCHLDD